MTKHTKHTNLERRDNDLFAPNEISFVGANCNSISDLVKAISQKLPRYKLAYFDASHAKDVQETNVSEFVFHHRGNLQVSTTSPVNTYLQRLQFSQFDCIFINGNHYKAAKQILILDPQKEASVLKRLDQLDRIQFVIKLNKDTEYFSFLEKKFPKIKNLICYTIDEVDKISHQIDQLIQEKIAPVKGLVLVGGKSTRMGKDKSTLDYFGKPQKQAAKELLVSNNLETYYSVQKQTDKADEISDTFLNLGPFGGICSAFQKNPNVAWLVLATDLPFVDSKLIQLLLQKRNPSKVATAIKGKGNQFVEPLITIYEPKAYPLLLQYLAQGYSCPRKMLINSDVEIVEVDAAFIRNVNTPEEFELAKKELQ
ncbi:molybdenum cofactor guanylyltransferase [Polaribacter pacificus]|uniref:Molybdenum cofactor guanylyltransferase n=1 Tax=Polaribacter pacificus TaxID=1775173 RepID=A0A917HWA3_9FLAO|nr:NTP transferase domain-containing protein [Polaribacter pacificus]GGG94295.1 molybdenum cofactor guanylyltransferase [Polaribacter pacificus]